LVGIFFGIEFAVDGGEGAEELIGDVSEDGGTTGRDFVFGEEKERRARKSLMGMAERNSLRSVVRKAAVSAGSRWFSGRLA